MSTKKARQRVSYVLENAKASAGGHRLGVLGLAVDADRSILYSGGRDGVVCAWDLNLGLRNRTSDTTDSATSTEAKPATKFRAQTHAHMHWINDVVLAQNNTALVSASSDLNVKVWRPHSEEQNGAQSIGAHADYANRLAAPPADMGLNWVASGGFDRKVCLWDLNGAGKVLEIDTKGDDKPEKGSVYALSVGRNMLAVGSPEKTVRLYDSRSGSRISKLVGHVDNIRSILIDDAGDNILSASADKTIKLWSIKGGRCMYTFTMHDEAVWSLYSDDPRLGVFYSSDRSGLVAKTDVRGSIEDMDDGVSVAVAKDYSSVWKVTAAGGHIWTASGQSSINRWEDVDMDDHAQLRDSFRRQRGVSVTSNKTRSTSASSPETPAKKEIPASSILRVSNTAPLPLRSEIDAETKPTSESLSRKVSELVIDDHIDLEVNPIHELPTETIEGQFGLLKHQLLNDRRRVLTLDTAGEVLMWDLIKCKPIQSFGKQHLEDVELQVNTREAVAPWCSIDLSSGNLTVVLEQYNCFDAEVYADELELGEPVEFREDQRISLGRWILRYLFANLIDEEAKRDEDYRQKLNKGIEKRRAAARPNAPTSIPLPDNTLTGWERSETTTTPKANGLQVPATTPGLAIHQATPGPVPPLPGVPEGAAASPISPHEKRSSQASRPSGEDYFSSTIGPADGPKTAGTPATPVAESTDVKATADDKNKDKDKEKDKDKTGDNGKSPGTAFGKKFRMSFGTKKLGRSASQTAPEKPAVVEEKEEESESSSNHEKEVEDSFYGVIQKMHNDYEKQLAEVPDKPVETRMSPSLPSETPVLKLPPDTKVIIQVETSGSVANVYEGTVGTVGDDADTIEQKGPMWLGHVLLQNQVTFKEPVKISFVLHPLGDLPPVASADGNNRLNANRMLRVKKILGYVAERIEQRPETPEENVLRPEEYLELYCNDQLLDPLMSLATLRTQVWKHGNDIVLYYKSNGRKEMRFAPPPPDPASEAEPAQEATTAPAQTNAATTGPVA